VVPCELHNNLRNKKYYTEKIKMHGKTKCCEGGEENDYVDYVTLTLLKKKNRK